MLHIHILKKSNVFVAIFPTARCSLRSMNYKFVVIDHELLVWLLNRLNCCVVIELTKKLKSSFHNAP